MWSPDSRWSRPGVTLKTISPILEQEGWIAAEWGVSENNRKAKYTAGGVISKTEASLRTQRISAISALTLAMTK